MRAGAFDYHGRHEQGIAQQERATLPALRTAGLVLVRRGRSQDFQVRRQIAETPRDRDVAIRCNRG